MNKAWLIGFGVPFWVSCATHPVFEEQHEEHVQQQAGTIPPRPEQVEAVRKPIWATEGASAEYHFALAQAHSAQGDPDRAIEEYRLALAYDSKTALVHARIAAEYVKKGFLSQALESAKEAIRIDPAFAEARLLLAGLYAESGDSDSALQEYRAILKKNPAHEEAAVFISQILADQGKPEEARGMLRAFVKAHPKAVVGWFYLGKMEQQLKKFPEAHLAYQRALELKPTFALASLARAYLYEAENKTALAKNIYTSLYQDTQDERAASRLITILLKEESYAESLPYIEFISRQDPDDLGNLVKLGLVYMELKKPEKAIAAFLSVLAKSPESDRVRFYLGSLYEDQGSGELAIEQYSKVSVGSKFFDDSVLHSAHILSASGKMEDARSYLLSSMERSPGSSTFPIYLASLEEDENHIDAAISVLEKALSKFPEEERIRYYLGSLYDKQGKTDLALQQMEWILARTPEHADALNYVGYTWTLQGVRLSEAEKMLRHAISLKPDNAYIQDSLGWHYFIRGRVGEAVVVLEKAAKLKPTEPVILEHLADAYLRLNLREKALRNYNEAIRYSSQDGSKVKLEQKVNELLIEIAGGPYIPQKASRVPASVSTPETDTED